MADDGDRRRMQAIGDLIKSWGVVPYWQGGWETRGLTWARVPWGFTEHHDVSSIKSGEWGSLGIIITGRPGVSGPLAQFQVARCLDDVPKVAIVAAGRANHAGTGGPYRFPDGVTVPANNANAYLYGAEVANNGTGEPYTAACHYAIEALERAVLEVCG